MPLAMEATRFRTGATEIQSETMGGFFSWATYAFVQPRACGQSLYWSVSGLYDIFRMSSHAGSSSIWASRMRASWSNAWRVAFCVDMYVAGTMITGRNQEKTSAPWHERCLSEPSISTLGLISVLHRWTIGGRRCLKKCDRSAELSYALLAQLISACDGETETAQSWSIRIVFDKDWSPPWPMADLEVDAVRVIRLDVDERGIVDLTQWRDVKSSLLPMAYESSVYLCSDADGLPCVPLGVLCQRLASYSGFEFLLMQVFYAISLRLEAMLKTFRPTGGKQLAKGSIRLKFPDEADLAGNKEQPYLCAAYVHHCRSLMRQPVDTGIATDKGSAHGLPLQTTILSWPNNFAAVAPPQVAAAIEQITACKHNKACCRHVVFGLWGIRPPTGLAHRFLSL